MSGSKAPYDIYEFFCASVKFQSCKDGSTHRAGVWYVAREHTLWKSKLIIVSLSSPNKMLVQKTIISIKID